MLSLDSPPFPDKQYPTVQELCMESIKHFNPIALRSSVQKVSTAAELRPLEAVFQDELYRSTFSLLGHVYLSSGWSGKTKNGRFDFVVPKMKWGIECVRDSSKLQEHIKRFLPGGRYHQWIASGQMTEYIILDFRQGTPKKPIGL
jgi:hypothetical protein